MDTCVGLDIGYKTIKAVEVTQGHRIIDITAVDLQTSSDENEDHWYAETIKDTFRRKKFSEDNVVIDVNGAYIITRTYAPPSTNREEFDQWFVDNIESLVPGTSLEDVIFDHEFLDSGRVIIPFARLSMVKKRIDILKAAGIFPSAVEASCLALYYAFAWHPLTKSNKTFAIANVSYGSTRLLIVKEREPYVSTEISYGGHDLQKGKRKNKIFASALAKHLERALDYYRKTDGINVKHLLLVGDYAKVPKLRKAVAAALGIEASIGNPFGAREISLPADFDKKHAHKYAEAFGLALKGISGNQGINLIPPELRKSYADWQFSKRARKGFKKHVVAASIIGTILLVLLGFIVHRNHGCARIVRNLEEEHNSLLYVEQDSEELSTKMRTLQSLNKEQFQWTRILSDIGRAVPRGLHFDQIATESRLVSSGSQPQKTRQLTLEGEARNNETVIRFIADLERYFHEINLDNISEDQECAFKISLTL